MVDMKGKRFNAGQIYVALSRVKAITGLHIVNFNAKAIKKSTQVDKKIDRFRDNLYQQFHRYNFDRFNTCYSGIT